MISIFVPCRDAEDAAAKIVEIVKDRIPARFGLDPIREIQVLCPMKRGGLGARALNLELQKALNPPDEDSIERFGWTFGAGDKVMQVENAYDKDVYNGDLGFIHAVDPEAGEVLIEFDGREVAYGFGELDELALAYATTIHKSQGSEYPAVVIPLTTQALPHAPAQSALHGRDPRQAPRGDRWTAEGNRNRGPRRPVAPALVEAQGLVGVAGLIS